MDGGLLDALPERLRHGLKLAREVRELLSRDDVVPPNPSDGPTRPIRMGFMLDVVAYGSRSTPAKERVQERLAAVVRLVVADLGVELSHTDRQGAGDGVLVFLPPDLDVQRALPVLLRSTVARLAHDNGEFRDRMRLRMSADVGPVGLAELGFGGATATSAGRLLDSKPLRKWVVDRPDEDLAVAISDRLHSFVVAEGVPGLASEQFTQIRVRIKELTTDAWLWTGR